MAKLNKISESAKTVNNSSNVEVTNQEGTTQEATTQEATTQEATTQEAKEVDNTPTLNADPAKIWDALCTAIGVEDRVKRTDRDSNTIDRQFYGIARATTLALLAGGQDAILERVKSLESDTPKKVANLLAKGYNRQAVACYFELCLLRGVQLSTNEFEKCYICTEGVKERGTKIGGKILEKFETLNISSKEEAQKWVNRYSSEELKDSQILAYIRANPCTYEEAIIALSKGGAKMRLNFDDLKKLCIYEINYTSNSAVKDYVYFAIK